MGTDESLSKELLEELEDDGEQYFSGGFWNNIVDLVLTVATIVASLVVTGLTAADHKGLPPWVIPTLAAIPAAAAGIQKTVRVRDRSNWYFLFAAHVRSLATKLKYDNTVSVQEIGSEFAKLELDMEIRWAEIGRSGTSGGPRHPHDPPHKPPETNELRRPL